MYLSSYIVRALVFCVKSLLLCSKESIHELGLVKHG